MKRIFLSMMIALTMPLLSSCGFFSENDDTDSGAGGKDEEAVNYSDVITQTMNESNELLQDFNQALDSFYANQLTEKTFGERMEEYIPRANEIAGNLDNVMYDVEPGLHEFHRSLIDLTNQQHQMFLDAVDMANDEDKNVDKETLREQYSSIKQTQATLIEEYQTKQMETEEEN
ncbi:hypothetical protein [Salibacterium aidingense]|uniref:hypothetical protein n=1 Tax=Salibacterium aidingense TaxID=384933 RepID=UPI0003F625C2|nr:hypothetical protein [Salibacterium aidingense]